jgi:NADH-quinone oxidoreductase subunit H
MVRSSRSFFLAVALIALFSWGLMGCSRDPLPELITLSDALPREVEVGDRLEIVGASLPEGRVARVTFRGNLNRPGEATIHDAEIVAEGNVTASDRVEIPYTDELQAEFCGAGNEAIHTTFDGAVEVAFAATFVGAPPVAATLAHASIDFRPPLRASSAAAVEAERLFAFAGIHRLDGDAQSSSVSIAAVDSGSRAEAAGLLDGDEIIAFNDVRVLSISDIAAIEGAPVARVRVRRAGGIETTALLSLAGFRQAPLVDRFVWVLVLMLTGGIFLVRTSPVSRLLFGFARRVELRSGSLARAPIAGWSEKYGIWWSTLALSVVMISVSCGAEALGSRADVPAVLGAVAVASTLIALLARGLRDAFRVATFQLVASLAVAGVVVLSGSVRVDEIASTQGALPWSWIAFHGPAGLAAFVIFALALVASTTRKSKSPEFSRLLESRSALDPLGLSDAFRIALACSLAVPLFLGGGKSFAGAGHSIAFVVALVKAGALFSAVATLRALMPMPLRFVHLAPLAVVALAATFAQTMLQLDRHVALVVYLATFVGAMLAAAHALWIARSFTRANAREKTGEKLGNLTAPSPVSLRPSPFL